MNNTKKTKTIAIVLLTALLFSFGKKPHYVINGVFKGGIGKLLLLEDVSNQNTIKIIDSVHVDTNGKFTFKWRNFLKKNDYVVWDQASSLNEWKCPSAKIFSVTTIPETILIDKNGVIAARGLKGKELELKIKELLS
ncbi:hypothetical protein Q4Q35_13240 [Flavivirga aquimarina]|uniref:Thioredoxin-like fold domain-containing protein n=1 Tax=Flavivirga aquimarina TaxID=2027862 RepID=A0ABT8WCD2_9FLAO|nr:hypothetical protein [Flavivirga aquimarina]MDO5970775.1 hypothetical protein [Flavivirga aquimarina]